MNKNLKTNNFKEDEIDLDFDLLEILGKLWKERKLIIKTTIIFFLLSIAYSLSLIDIYESSSTFYPHNEKAANPSLRNLAGIAGINLEQNSYTEIPTSLYPNLVESIPYKEDILNAKIIIHSKELTYRDYLRNLNQNPSILSFLIEYTVGLPSKIILFIKSIVSKAIVSKDSNSLITYNKNYLSFNDKDYNLFKSLENTINLKANTKDGYLILSVKDQLPEVAAQIAQIAQDKLQERIINYKLKNTMSLYDYTSEQFEKRKNEFYYLQDSLANFKDRNKSIKSVIFLNQLKRLQYEVDLRNSIYKELALTKEKVNLEIKKNTPIFTIINPVILPYNRAEPQRTSIVITYTFLGLIISTIIVLTKDSLLKIKKAILS